MKKLLAIIAVAGFVACNNSAESEKATTDTPAVTTPDTSVVATPDTNAAATPDTGAAKADTSVKK